MIGPRESLWLVIGNGASTFALVGLIWTVQLVHYPGFRFISEERFVEFEQFHQRQISYVVMPLMLVELITAAALIFWRPESISLSVAVAGLVLIAIIWLSTFAFQVPLHARLAEGFDQDAVERLVRTNWIRTVAWTLRGVLMAYVLARVLTPWEAGV